MFTKFHLLACCLTLAGLVACQPEPAKFQATDISGASFGKALALNDHEGKPRRLDDFRGKAVVLFFGYTSCPDVCPTTLARYAEVMKALGNEADRVQVLFVTLDPRRDDAARLKAFVPWFDARFLGLYGDAATTAAVAKEFLVHSAVKEVGGGLGYVIDHSAGSYVFDPGGRLRLYVGDSAPVDAIVSDIRLLLAGR